MAVGGGDSTMFSVEGFAGIWPWGVRDEKGAWVLTLSPDYPHAGEVARFLTEQLNEAYANEKWPFGSPLSERGEGR